MSKLQPDTSKQGWQQRYAEIMLRWIESQWKIEQAYQNGETYTRMNFEADAAKVDKELKSFIQQEIYRAVKEERERCLECVDSMDNYNDDRPTDEDFNRGYFYCLEKVRDKIKNG